MKAARLQPELASGPPAIDAREDERRRLAREMHDGPAQSMAAALFGVDLALIALDREPVTARDEILRARELLRDALDDVRGMMAGLRPRLLDERGLLAALRSLAGGTPLWGPEITVHAQGLNDADRLPADVELALYRIAQEAVSNARRHGAAAHVAVTVVRESGGAVLEVADDGRGFPPRRIRPASGRGEGLPGMRERASLLGGELMIRSTPQTGTRITVTVPLVDGNTRIREGKQ
jgi:signal transduction histidine kinase